MGDDANIVHLNIIGHAVVQNPGGKDYVTYIIDLQQGSAGWQIFRRFASFVALGHVIRQRVPAAPPCPPKKVFGRKTPEFLEQRRVSLESWLRELLGMGEVCAILEFQHFLQAEANGEESAADHGALRRGITLQDFVLIKVIGKGSFGKVLLVRKRDTGDVYAMKVLRKKQVLRRNQIEHTITERNVLTRIDHPFVVGLKFAFQSPEKLYFVLDYCAGGELFYHLGQARRFPEERARFYAAELALALGHMHELNVIYRDLKPENVLIDAEGHVRLTDFGLSKENVTSVAEGASSFCGTPEYLAPEVLDRKGHGRAVDWWSLGALLYEMLTGLPPFYAKDREVMFDKIRRARLVLPDCLSPEAQDILVRLLRRDPQARLGSGPADAAEVRGHPFFASIQWDALRRRRVSPPWVPPIRDGVDTSHFSSEFTALPVGTPGGGTLPTGTTPLLNFQGFTYVHPTNVPAGEEGKVGDAVSDSSAGRGEEGKGEDAGAWQAAGRATAAASPPRRPWGHSGRGHGTHMEEEEEEEEEGEYRDGEGGGPRGADGYYGRDESHSSTAAGAATRRHGGGRMLAEGKYNDDCWTGSDTHSTGSALTQPSAGTGRSGGDAARPHGDASTRPYRGMSVEDEP